MCSVQAEMQVVSKRVLICEFEWSSLTYSRYRLSRHRVRSDFLFPFNLITKPDVLKLRVRDIISLEIVKR